MKTKWIILVLLQIFLFNDLFGQSKILYHHISRTASSWNIVEWDIKQVQDKKWLLEEYVDEKGRVVELCFYKEGSLDYRHQCYLANRVTFEYKENKIIETLYLNENPIFWNGCEKNHRSIYYLDKEGYIEKVDYIYEFDFNSNKKSEYTINEFKPIKIITPEDRQLQVEYFYDSFAKMNGKYPVSRNYEFRDDFYYGSQPEKSSILKGLKSK